MRRFRKGGRYTSDVESLSTKTHVVTNITFKNITFKGNIQPAGNWNRPAT
jgi:hypothetical protein